MRKKKINVPIYLLFSANCIYAVSQKDFSWLFYVSAVLTAAAIVLDVREVLKHVRKK